MNEKILTGILFILVIIPLCISPASAGGEVWVNGGRVEVSGSPDDPYTSAAAKNDITIRVGRLGATVWITANYFICCAGDADDGYCCLQFLDGSDSVSASSGETDQGTLGIRKYVYPGHAIGWKLTAKYYDWWGGSTFIRR